MDNNQLEQEKEYKYFGYLLKVDCKGMMTDTISKLNYVLYIFKRVGTPLTLNSAKAISQSKFLSYINYIHLFLYLASKKDNKKLQTLQNDCIRCIASQNDPMLTNIIVISIPFM